MLSALIGDFKSSLPIIMVDRSLAFERPETETAAAYWLAQRGERLMPLRRELKPSAMAPFLRFVNLVDVDHDDCSYYVKLQGSHTREVFGDLQGKRFRDLFPPEVAQRWRYGFDLVRDSGSPVRLSTQIATQRALCLKSEVFIAALGNSAETAQLGSLFWVFVSWNLSNGLLTSFSRCRAKPRAADTGSESLSY